MSIVSWSVISDQRLSGGRGLVIGEHLWGDGKRVQVLFEAAFSEDAMARLAGMVTEREATAATAEIVKNIMDVTRRGSLATPTFVDSTTTANATALREAYKDMVQAEAVMTGDYLNTLTNAQIAGAFGITTGQAATLRTNKLAPAAALATSMRAEVGA